MTAMPMLQLTPPEAMQWLVLLACVALAGSARVRAPAQRHRTDWVFLATLAPFAALSSLHLLSHMGLLDDAFLAPATRIAYPLMIVAVTVFMMVLLRGGTPLHRVLLAVQVVVGIGLAGWPSAAWPWPDVSAWKWFNLALSTGLIGLMAHALWHHGATRGWTLLMAAIAALGVMAGDMSSPPDDIMDVSWLQVLYTAILLLLWLLATRRLRGGVARRPVADDAQDEVRRHLAQELHDGVGSQLTSIISALDAGSPDPHETAARLRECQLELKLLVDGVDVHASLLGLLANLRYRMQPLLEAAHIDLRWLIADEDWLDEVRGDVARQVLRIAQEALANAVRHSGASALTVICCRGKAENVLRLEVADNGIGMARQQVAAGDSGQGQGKGLTGMYARARQIGGQLSFESRYGEGVRMLLRVPVPPSGAARAEP